jgi:hypothetical protein
MSNIIDPTKLRIVDDISSAYLHSKNMFFMVLLNVSEPAKEADIQYGIGIITHYFVIVQREGRFFIISSYGSSFCIPQKEVELDLEEWKEFVDVFTDPDKKVKQDSKIMISTLQKYFLPLSDDVVLKYPEEDDRVFKDEEEAIQHEVQFYIDHEHKICSIDNIVELILPFIPPVKEVKFKKSKRSGGKRRKKKYTRKVFC